MPAITTRQLGQTNLHPTALSLGCAWIGSRNDSDAEAAAVVRRMLELGPCLLDTDASYQHGTGEARLGRVLRVLRDAAGVRREQYYLSTKVGTHPARPGDFSAEAARWTVRQSLRTLGVDHLDLLLIHDPPNIDAPLAPGAALDEMVKMKKQGLVRYLGIGCRPHAFHRRAMQTGVIDVILPFKDYTLLNQSAAEDIIPIAQQRGVGVLLGSPLDMGRLAGTEPNARDAPRAHAMWDWCRRRGYSVRDLALQFALGLPIDGAVLVGPATLAEANASIASATRPIPDELWQEFELAFGVHLPTGSD